MDKEAHLRQGRDLPSDSDLATRADLARVLERLEVIERRLPPMDDVGGIRALMGWIGAETIAGCKSAVHRDPELAALAFRSGNARRWRRAEVEALLERRRADANQPRRKRLRAVRGGQ